MGDMNVLYRILTLDHVKSAHINGKAHSLVADGGDGLQMWKAAENTHINCHR